MYKLPFLKYDYQKNYIIRLSDNAFIPQDPANTDYQAYLKYVEEGGEVLPADEPSES